MWGKKEQYVLWSTAYLPLVLLMIYRFIDSNNFFKHSNAVYWLSKQINEYLLDLLVVIAIIVFSIFLFRSITKWYFKDLESEMLVGGRGNIFFVRNYESLSVNDYSFFLMTLFIPLISIDTASILNLAITILTITIVILIYVKTNTLSVCPVFFTSGKYVYKAVISEYPKHMEEENPALRLSVIIITPSKHLDMNKKFRACKLTSNIYYLTEIPPT